MAAEHNRIAEAAAGKVSAFEGAGLIQDAADLSTQVASGQWAGGLASLLSAGLNIRDTLQDPMAKLISMGLGWVIEFFGPLNTWLDWLTCDTEQLTVAAETWSGISAELRTTADELDGYHKADSAAWSGPAVDQYRLFCADRVNLYNAAAGAAASTANLINHNKVLLTAVRSIVRDLITDGVGKAISIILRYPPPATLAASGEVGIQVARTGNAIVDLVRKLQGALKNARGMLRQSGNIFKEVSSQLRYAKWSSGSFRTPGMTTKLYDRQIGLALDDAANVAKYAAKTAGVDTAKSLPGRIGVESIREPTKYGEGRVDETAPTHPDIEKARRQEGDGT